MSSVKLNHNYKGINASEWNTIFLFLNIKNLSNFNVLFLYKEINKLILIKII